MAGVGCGAKAQNARCIQKERFAGLRGHDVYQQRFALYAGIGLGKNLARAKALEDEAIAPGVHALDAHTALQHQAYLQRQFPGAQQRFPGAIPAAARR